MIHKMREHIQFIVENEEMKYLIFQKVLDNMFSNHLQINEHIEEILPYLKNQ